MIVLNDVILGTAGLATVLALLYAPAARWTWAVAALAVALWATAAGGLAAGLPLVGGVLAATAIESADAPAVPGFDNMVARVAALLGALAVATLIAVRVLLLDLVASVEAFALLGTGLGAAFYMLAHGGPVEEARAARVALTVAAAAWVAAGHPNPTVSVVSAGMLILLAATPRRLARP